jgi:hypothetical protein
MKIKWLIFSLTTALFTFSNCLAQEANENEPREKDNKEQHISLEKFPKNMVINHLNGWGGMTVAINELPAGTDLAPLL